MHTVKISWNNLRKLVDCLDQHNIKFDTDFLVNVEFDGSMYQLDEIIKQTGGVVKIPDEPKVNKNGDSFVYSGMSLSPGMVFTSNIQQPNPP